MIASLGSSASLLVAYANPPDFAEWQVWKRYLRPGDLFVDVGANVGTYSLLAADRGASVIAVEPDPENARRLKANFDLNGYPHEVWTVALTARSGDFTFTEGADSQNHLAVGAGRTLRGEPYDALIEGRHVHGMKIDVEGAERQVLEGARLALSEGRLGLMQIEWNHRAVVNFGEDRTGLAQLLGDYGYSLHRASLTGHLIPFDGIEGADVFAVRDDVPERLR